MLGSRSFAEIDCLTQSSVLNLCVSDADLRAIGAWCGRKSAGGLTPALRCRAALVRSDRLGDDGSLGRRLADLLDVRHFETVARVRGGPESEAVAAACGWLDRPVGERLAPLVWALVTDPRAEVHRWGRRLVQEGLVRACRAYATSPLGRPSRTERPSGE